MERRHLFGGAQPRVELEARFAELLMRDFAPVEQATDGGYDFCTSDGRCVIELKQALLGSRDLHEALLRLAFVLVEQPTIERAVLVAQCPRVSVERLRHEWGRMRGALQSTVAERLGLVALAADGDLALPEEPAAYRLLLIAREAFHQERPTIERRPASQKWSSKTLEIWKVLLSAWLRSEGLLPIQEIVSRSGCSRPTVNTVFEFLARGKELARGTNRSGGLAGMPRESLLEVLILANDLRRTSRFIDGSGRRPDPVGLVRRLNEKSPAGVAFGGVVAARHYQPNFDLNGLPRIDVTVHGERSLAWLSNVDPALQPVHSNDQQPVVVVHHLLRSEARFEGRGPGALPIADPAETLLDLYDLRLTEQAEEFVRAMRAKGTAHV